MNNCCPNKRMPENVSFVGEFNECVCKCAGLLWIWQNISSTQWDLVINSCSANKYIANICIGDVFQRDFRTSPMCNVMPVFIMITQVCSEKYLSIRFALHQCTCWRTTQYIHCPGVVLTVILRYTIINPHYLHIIKASLDSYKNLDNDGYNSNCADFTNLSYPFTWPMAHRDHSLAATAA